MSFWKRAERNLRTSAFLFALLHTIFTSVRPDAITRNCVVTSEILLASDGTVELEYGKDMRANSTVNGTVSSEMYQYYHVFIYRHKHEHRVEVNLTCFDQGDANLYMTSEDEACPRKGHAHWIAQHPGDDHVRLFTFLNGFPRAANHKHSSMIPLHIGVYGASEDQPIHYNLSIAVFDLPVNKKIEELTAYYSQLHEIYKRQRRVS